MTRREERMAGGRRTAVVVAAVVAGAAAVGATLPAPGAGQSLAERVEAREGTISFRVALRPDVRVCDTGIRMGADRFSGSWPRGRGPGACSEGAGRVAVELRDGRIVDLELLPLDPAPLGEGDEAAALPRANELGEIPPADAADFLLSVARRAGSRRVGSAALMTAGLLDGVETWPEMLEMARDRRVRDEVRKAALFWVSRAAAEEVTRGLAEIASGDDEARSLRDAAVFALSQRPSDEGVPVLMELARTAEHAGTREKALFWLAQKGGDRVADFFAEILVGRGNGAGG